MTQLLSSTSVLEVLDRIRTLMNGQLPDLARQIDEEISKLKAERFHLVVLGQFKRGKTTFINALLEEELLPVGVLPVTSVVTLVEHGLTRRVEVVFNDGTKKDIDPSALPEFITERANPGNTKGVRYVHVTHAAPLLEGGIVLIDTPGIGSVFLQNTETTREFIPKIDAAVMVLSAEPPITQTEYEFLDEILQHTNTIFFVLNKIDQHTDREVSESLAYLKEVLEKKLGRERVTVFPVSAREALAVTAKGRVEDGNSGIAAVVEVIFSFLGKEKMPVLLRRARQRAMIVLSRLTFATELELKATITPLEELTQKIGEFERRIEVLQKEREKFSYLIKGETETLQRWVEEQLKEFQLYESERLIQVVSRWAQDQMHLGFWELREALRREISSLLVTDLESWREQYEPEILQRYERIAQTHTDRTNAFINDLINLSAGLFQLRVGMVEDVEGIAWREQFSYRIEYEPIFLEIDWLTTGAALLPRRLVVNKLVQRFLHHVPVHVMRNCGSLSYQYTYSIQETMLKFQHDMKERMDALTSEINEILRSAVEWRSVQLGTVGSRSEVLEQRLAECRTLADQLQGT